MEIHLRDRTALVSLALSLALAGACSDAKSPVRPTENGPAVPVGVAPRVSGVYVVTFKASASCALALPPAARERTYTATFYSDGLIKWTGPTLKPPPGHAAISSETLTENVLSFSIDVERDPQSDAFNGLWDTMGNGSILTIAGKGVGAVRGGEIDGFLNGQFAFYGSPAGGEGRYCMATDHGFRFVAQP